MKKYTKNWVKPSRYDEMTYRRCGNSGLLLPAISLGLWQNFGHSTPIGKMREILRSAFNSGITHFDLANNYGPPYGAAEENFGRILNTDFLSYRDELIISTKAGYDMWPGPYGNWGSRKYLISSCEQSLKRMGTNYVDIFYHHRPDPNTPLEETLLALDHLARQGKALYIGLSNYNAAQTEEALQIFNELKTPFIINQPRFNMLDRLVEQGLLHFLKDKEIGLIAFSPLEQGILTDKYLKGIPTGSRASNPEINSLDAKGISPKKLEAVQTLNDLAKIRGQSLAQMALSWLLSHEGVTSVLVGASSVEQLQDNLRCLKNIKFSKDDYRRIEKIVKHVKYND